jgi:hypothetical protein
VDFRAAPSLFFPPLLQATALTTSLLIVQINAALAKSLLEIKDITWEKKQNRIIQK